MRTTIHNLPDHQAIDANEVVPFIDKLIERHEEEVELIVDTAKTEPTWDNLMMPMESLEVELNDS